MSIQIRTERIRLRDGNERLKLIHLSDLHFFYRKNVATMIINYITESRPDLIVLTGDYFDSLMGYRIVRNLFRSVAQIAPVVFIAGNHDRLYGRRWIEQLNEVDNCTLLDGITCQFISPNGYCYELHPWELVNQIRSSSSVNIALIHNPEKIKKKNMQHVHLILGGHLHGGQFVFWKSGAGHLYPGSFVYKYCVDSKQIGDTRLIVSRGLGDTFPIRYNCPKEIVEIYIE